MRLVVDPGDVRDVEFESFNEMTSVLDGMAKSLVNTDWLADKLTQQQMDQVVGAIYDLRNVLEEYLVALDGDVRPARPALPQS